jgi:alpha-tubulin suppressor-like RCC1 family protein
MRLLSWLTCSFLALLSLSSTAETLSSGDGFLCIILDGKVLCVGQNHLGQLGDGTTVDRKQTVATQGVDGAKAISAGGYHACALMPEGRVKCWGNNSYGELGDGTQEDRTIPVDVKGLPPVTAVFAGSSGSCATEASGALWCWGEHGRDSEMSDKPGPWRQAPVRFPGLKNVQQVVFGANHVCAIHDQGEVSCWGSNGQNQLGSEGMKESSRPLKVKGFKGSVIHLATRFHHTCAVVDTGQVQCWGWNDESQLGRPEGQMFTDDPRPKFRSAEPLVIEGVNDAVRVAAGQNHACALRRSGRVACWGGDGSGQLGGQRYGRRQIVPQDMHEREGIENVVAGSSYTCTIKGVSDLKCTLTFP